MEPTLRVVVVEDDPLMMADLARMLRAGGHDVVATCATAAEMTQAVLALAPDAVVFDVHLPGGGDGISTFRAVSRDHPCAGIAVTGDRSAATAQKAIENDVLAFCLKPVNPTQLLIDIRLASAHAKNMERMRTEMAIFSAAIDDPTGVVLRAKAKLGRKPFHMNEVGAHAQLIKKAHDLNLSIVRVAEMMLDDEFDMGWYCNLKRPLPPPHPAADGRLVTLHGGHNPR